MAANLSRVVSTRVAVAGMGSVTLAATRPAGFRLFSSSDEEDVRKERDSIEASQSKRGEDGEEETEEGDGGGDEHVNRETGEVGGPRGPEPTRYGDWEQKGRCSDF